MRLRAFAWVELHLDWPGLSRLTARQWFAMERAVLERGRRRDVMLEFMLAQLTAVTVNSSMCAPKPPMRTDSFMPTRRKAPKASRSQRVDRAAIADGVRTFFAALSRAG